MKILLAGGAGYIGSHTAIALAQAGHDIVILDSLVNSKAESVERVGTIIGRPVPLVVGDIRDVACVTDTLREHAIDAVVHFAGHKAVGESVANPLMYYDANVGGTIRLIEAMNAASVRNLVFSSSATVYGDPRYLPLDEDHPTSATNPYGRTKLMIEEMLTDIAASDPQWRIAILRYFNPVGAHDSGLIGEDPNGVPNNLMPYISRVASGKLEQLQVFGDDYDTPDGTGVRDYIHVVDLAEGHLRALETIAARPQPLSIWNLGTGTGFSVLDLVRTFQEATGVEINYRIAPRRPGDVATCYADPSRARADLGWTAQRNLTDMCASAWNFEQIMRTRNA